MDHQTISLAIRWLHVVAMAMALGGMLLMTWLAWRLPAPRVIEIASRYEQLFWLAIGVLVMTGVGNLGGFGVALPPPTAAWGQTFVAKLTLVAILILISLPRSLAVLRLARVSMPDPSLRGIYTSSSALLAVIVALALGLAHG